MTVPMAFFIAAWTYPFCVNFVPAYRDVADKFSTTEIGITNVQGNDLENPMSEKDGADGIEAKETAAAASENAGTTTKA